MKKNCFLLFMVCFLFFVFCPSIIVEILNKVVADGLPLPSESGPAKKETFTATKIFVTEPIKVKRQSVLSEESKNELTLLEGRIKDFMLRSDEERNNLTKRLEERDKIINRVILLGLATLLVIVLLVKYVLRSLGERLRSEKGQEFREVTPSRETKEESLAFKEDPEQFFYNWLNNLPNKEIIQIISCLISNPEKNIREKAFIFLEKMWQTKEFTSEEQLKIERLIRKVGLEEGWISE